MERVKVGNGYWQSGYGKGLKKKPTVYLINGRLYAKDKASWHVDYNQLYGELEGYVRINKMVLRNETLFYQVSASEHKDA